MQSVLETLKDNTPRLGLPSASGFDRTVHCPGSRTLEAQCTGPEPSEDEDPDAARGSRIHTAFQTGNTLELDEEETEAYAAGVKFTEMLVSDWQRTYNLTAVTEGPRECRMWYNHPEDLRPLCSAQLDRHYLCPPFAASIDLKSGWAIHVPPATRAWQLRMQALVLWKEYAPDIKHVRVAFARAMSKVTPSDYADYSESDLQNAEQSLLYHLWEAEQPDATRHVGPWCRYCKAALASICPEAGAYALLPSVIASRAMPISKDFDAETAVARLAPADLVKIFQSSTIIAQIIAAVKSRLKGMTDEELRSLDLERGKGRETWRVAKNAECVAYLLAQGWTQEQVFACIKFSNEALAENMRKEKGLPSDKAASAFMKKELKEFATVDVSEPPLRTIKPF